MAWRLVHEHMQRRLVRRERIFRDRTHPLEVYDDVELVERYRFRRADILWLVEEFGGELEYDCARRGGLSPLMQVMVALRVFAAGAFQLDVATEFLFINLESQLRLAAEGTGNSLSALLDSHPYHVHTHICLCLRTLGVYIMIVNLTFSHCFNVF